MKTVPSFKKLAQLVSGFPELGASKGIDNKFPWKQLLNFELYARNTHKDVTFSPVHIPKPK